MRRRVIASIVVAVGAMTSACNTSVNGAATPASRISTPAAASEQTTIQRHTVDTWSPPGSETLPGKVLGKRAYWAGGPSSDLVNTIFSRDLERHSTSVVAVAQPGWRADWVKGDGHWLVYMEAADAATEEQPAPAWNMYVIDVDNSQKRLVASSKTSSGGVPPSPRVSGNALLWAQGSKAGKDLYDVLTVDLRQAKPIPKRLLVGKDISDYGLTPTDAVLLLKSKQQRDLYSLALDGTSRLTRLTTSGLVNRVNVSGRLAAYEESPQDGADPTRQYLVDVSRPTTRILISGPTKPNEVPDDNATPGRSFVAWFGPDGLRLARDSRTGQRITLTNVPDIQLRLDWQDDTLFWGETRAGVTGITNVLHVDRFDP